MTSALPLNTSAQIALFTDKIFLFCAQTYFNENYQVQLNVARTADINTQYMVDLDSGWTKISDAARVIQHHLNINNNRCVCRQQISPTSIQVHYIDKKHHQLGVDEQVIETWCRKKLILATCTSNIVEPEWKILKTKIFQRSDYGIDICLFDEQQTISFFGLPEVVNHVQQLFEDKKIKNVPSVVKNEANKLEVLPIPKPPTLKIDNSPQISKTNIHQECNPLNAQKVEKFSITFDVDEPGFEIFVNEQFNQLLTVVKSKCQLEKQILHHQIQIQVPKANVHFNDPTLQTQPQENNSEPTNNSSQASINQKSNWILGLLGFRKSNQQSPSPVQQQKSTSQVQITSNVMNLASVAIGNSKIIVCTGDLTKQAVDMIVVCSTSSILCNAIISAAGSQVKHIFDQQSSNGTLTFETSGGNLSCMQIAFRPWTCDKYQPQNLKQSIDTFISSVITYALRHNITTLAFPSIGCGQRGYDPKLIAEYMIDETYRQLKSSVHPKLIISFVLLPGQQSIYDAFSDRLNAIKIIEDKPTSISFDKQTVKIKLIGLNKNELIECQNKIKQLARSYSLKLHLTDKIDMADWSQDIIQKYYNYCLQKRVSDTEKYFFQLTAEILRNARIQIISHGFVWSVEILSGTWEQYSYKINQQIEDAHMKKLSHIEFLNEKSERCRVVFSSMEEHYGTRKRKVCRQRIDSSLPNYWDLSSVNFKRIALSNSSKEYKDVLDRFESTMKGSYLTIVKIERIQNERWYKQYAAHRDEFIQKYTSSSEKLLFHGCRSTSAYKIVQECFNRAFAGVNGVSYGQGVYFHEHAKYSHGYTDGSSERTMFLARVLIGRTCIGNSSMKVPPEGFDTTTNGGHIFVIYHDAGAY
ncbi:unnamed protein product, partial [Rotaria sp. Silwood1]